MVGVTDSSTSAVTLYATTFTTGTGSIYSLSDTSGLGNTISGSFTNLLGASGVGGSFGLRGIQIVVPEPTSLALLVPGGLMLLARRRKA